VSPVARFLGWAETPVGPFRTVKAQRAPDGSARVRIPAGTVALEVDLSGQGYARKVVPSVLVPARGSGAVRVELEPCSDVRFTLAPEAARELRRHAVFLLDEGGDDLVRGPLAPGDPAANLRVGRVRLWADPSVAERRRLTFDGQGQARLRVSPGSYVLRCFPDDLALEPGRLTLAPGSATVALARVRR
jgi:hypothetical protein